MFIAPHPPPPISPIPRPADPCACGHPRNQHAGYGLGRCLTSCRARCVRLTPPSTS